MSKPPRKKKRRAHPPEGADAGVSLPRVEAAAPVAAAPKDAAAERPKRRPSSDEDRAQDRDEDRAQDRDEDRAQDRAPSADAKAPPPSAAAERAPRETTTVQELRVSAAVAVAAAVVIAVLVNILAARHYRRWDVTDDGLYTISRATEQVLRTLPDQVELYVLLSSSDPLTLTLRHLLEAYGALTSKLSVAYVDPDRDPAEFIALQQKFGIAAGKTEDGRIITDASIVIVRGERRHFVTAHDLIEVNEGDEARARSKVEQTLTAGIQVVVTGETPRVCFTSGYGEPSIEEGGVEGLLSLHSRLDKLNYEVAQLPPVRELDGKDPIGECKLVVVAGPNQRMDETDVLRLRRFVENGGNVLVFAGPELSPSGQGFVDQGLAPLVALAGVRRRQDLVFERDPGRAWTRGQGEAMVATPKPHAITQAFVELQGAVPIVLTLTSSFELLPDTPVVPIPLLSTSDRAFGMRRFAEWAQDPVPPSPSADDHPGPLMLAYAAELPKKRADAERGPRLVVFGTKSAVVGANWTNERLQGTGLLVESAISWLASETVLVDVPQKPARSLGAGITQQDVSAAAIKLVILLPLSAVLMGVGVALRRRLGSRDRVRRKETKS